MAIDEAFFIERRGVRMVLYAGVLQAAHQAGLKSITTELVQAPGPDNGELAIIKATVEMEDGRRFSGLGDASPRSTSSQMVPHLLRLAETRSKARALKDAVNIGAVSLEETGEDAPQSPARGETMRTTTEVPEAAQEAKERTPGGASVKSARKLWVMARDNGGVEAFEGTNGPIQQMSQQQVSRYIDQLKGEE